MTGLYVHIPFCESKCRYCGFFSCSGIFYMQKDYFAALRRHVSALPKEKLDTVYLGGGTPSAVDAAHIGVLLDHIRNHFSTSGEMECTIEINPASATKDKLAAYRAFGINRVSIGAQSFLDAELAFLGRRHRAADIISCVEDVRAAGFSNVSLDLIYGLPGQSVSDFSKSVDRLLTLSPEHVSCYGLSFEPGTPLFSDLNAGKFAALSDDLYFEQYEYLRKTLAAHGYEHYEISNFARPGRRSLHNQIYWRAEPYYAVGAGASAYFDGVRRTYTPDVPDYIKHPLKESEKETVDRSGQMSEAVLLGLRLLTDGVDTAAFAARFGRDIFDVFGKELEKHQKNGLLLYKNGRLLLTERAYYISNYVLCDFVR